MPAMKVMKAATKAKKVAVKVKSKAKPAPARHGKANALKGGGERQDWPNFRSTPCAPLRFGQS